MVNRKMLPRLISVTRNIERNSIIWTISHPSNPNSIAGDIFEMSDLDVDFSSYDQIVTFLKTNTGYEFSISYSAKRKIMAINDSNYNHDK